MKRIFNVVLLIFVAQLCFGQETKETKEKETKNLLTLAFGYTYIPQGAAEGSTEADGVFIPAIGLDYFRRIHPKWEIGTMIDLELGSYIIAKRDLNRENALIVVGIAAYNLTDHMTFFGGGGIELEKHENLWIGRLGGEYAFKFKNDWVIAPGFFYDLKKGYDSWALSVAFGKEF